MADYIARRTAMVDTQIRPSDVTKFPIIKAMLAVPKENFVPDAMRGAAYVGENILLSDDRVILEPRTTGKLLDALDIQPGETVLDLGCGLGYSSAVLAQLAELVVAVESDASLADDAQERLSENGADNVAVVAGPLEAGNAKNGPYDVIVIEGGVRQVPQAILDQLRVGGRVGAIFMDGALGTARVGLKTAAGVDWRFAFNASAPVIAAFDRQQEFVL